MARLVGLLVRHLHLLLGHLLVRLVELLARDLHLLLELEHLLVRLVELLVRDLHLLLGHLMCASAVCVGGRGSAKTQRPQRQLAYHAQRTATAKPLEAMTAEIDRQAQRSEETHTNKLRQKPIAPSFESASKESKI